MTIMVRVKLPVILRAGSFALFVLHGVLSARAAVQLLREPEPTAVFDNGRRVVRAQFQNPALQLTEAKLRFRLYQASASTLMPLGEIHDWKSVTLLAGQTILEAVEIEVPPVRGETAFQVAWFDGDRKLGTTQLSAFPQQLLKALSVLAGETPVGLVDPEDQFKAGLNGVPTAELKEAEGISASEAKLILIAPAPMEKWPAGLATALKKKAASGSAVVWIQPPARRQPEPLPQAYVVAEGAGQIVIAAAATVSGLADSPRAQLNLLRMAELATGRKKLELPVDAQP